MTAAVGTPDARSDEAVSSSPAGDARALVGVALFSADPASLAAFYGMLLGIRFERRVHPDGREHRIARIGDLHFEIKALHTGTGALTPDGSSQAGTGAVEISFEVTDAQAAFAYACTLGATELIPVREETYGYFGSVLDPDGNRLGLYSPHTTDREAR